MKNALKGFVVGVVLTLVLTGSFAIFADDIFEQISVLRNPSTITVNGSAMTGDHFEYLDRTYVPLREVCERLGMDVLWDGEKGTIDITPSKTALVVNGEKIDIETVAAAKKQLNVYFNSQGQTVTEEQLNEEAYLYVKDVPEGETVSYVSSNGGVVTVSPGGKVTAVGQGMATITITVGEKQITSIARCNFDATTEG